MNVAAGAFGTAVAGSAVPFLRGWLEWWYAPPILVLNAIIIISAINLMHRNRPQRIRDIRRIYLGGLGVFLALIVIRLTFP